MESGLQLHRHHEERQERHQHQECPGAGQIYLALHNTFAIHLSFLVIFIIFYHIIFSIKPFFGDPNYFSSFQISNRVTEFHYSDSEAVDADAADYHDNINEGHDDKTDSGADHASHGPDDRLELPPPVYPTINKKNKKNTFTKDQIIDLYCASTQDLR